MNINNVSNKKKEKRKKQKQQQHISVWTLSGNFEIFERCWILYVRCPIFNKLFRSTAFAKPECFADRIAHHCTVRFGKTSETCLIMHLEATPTETELHMIICEKARSLLLMCPLKKKKRNTGWQRQLPYIKQVTRKQLMCCATRMKREREREDKAERLFLFCNCAAR